MLELKDYNLGVSDLAPATKTLGIRRLLFSTSDRDGEVASRQGHCEQDLETQEVPKL